MSLLLLLLLPPPLGGVAGGGGRASVAQLLSLKPDWQMQRGVPLSVLHVPRALHDGVPGHWGLAQSEPDHRAVQVQPPPCAALLHVPWPLHVLDASHVLSVSVTLAVNVVLLYAYTAI